MKLHPSRAPEITGMIARLNGRSLPATPWVDGTDLPWADRWFSGLFASRMDYSASYGLPTAEEDVEALWGQLSLKPGQRVLDLACGPGRHTIELARRGIRAEGIDIGPGAVELARARAAETGVGAVFHLGDILDMGFVDEFDAAFMICGQVSNLRPRELGRLLACTAKALRAGGGFAMEFPDATGAEDTIKTGSSWAVMKGEWSIFGEEDHLVLQETFYDREQAASMDRYYVISPDGSMREMTKCTQYHHPQAIEAALQAAGFAPESIEPGHNGWKRVVSRKA